MTDLHTPLNEASAPGARPVPRLRSLTRHGRQADARARDLGMASWTDDLSHLTEARRASWRRVLSSIATTEGLEGTIMEPLIAGEAAARPDSEAHEYLVQHADDERRHHELLTGYLKNTFGFVKRTRTVSDRVFYEKILPGVSRSFRYKPVYGFALLYCYERFAMAFYAPLRGVAQADGAQNLLSLIQSIEKDELRHVAGMEYLLKEEIRRQGGLRRGDLRAVGAMLSLLLLDLNMKPWALHNREVRAHLLELGISPDEVTAIGPRMRDETLALMKSTTKHNEGARHVASQ